MKVKYRVHKRSGGQHYCSDAYLEAKLSLHRIGDPNETDIRRDAIVAYRFLRDSLPDGTFKYLKDIINAEGIRIE